MRSEDILTGWKLIVSENRDVVKENFAPKTPNEAEESGKTVISATVPGAFELDMIKAGILDGISTKEELYFGKNILSLQRLENRHLYYFTTFEIENKEGCDTFLHFGGIDTAAEIYLDGELIGTAENMLIPHSFKLSSENGTHGLLVHIIPSQIYTRRFDLPINTVGQPYNYESLKLRKAAYMYGWDIMPRAVSGGLWQPVKVMYLPKTRIEDMLIYTASVDTVNKKAMLRFALQIKTDAEYFQDLTYTVNGSCGDSRFSASGKFYGSHTFPAINVSDARFWMPRNYGEPNLYTVTVTLYENGEKADEKTVKTGIRTVSLERTSVAGDDGEFLFKVNGKKVFLMGTNWVPTDTFPAEISKYQLRGLKMMTDLHCNAVRCWGGGIYPDDDFYDYCDENGILVWQDFAMACGKYPDDERMLCQIKNEVTAVVKRLRNHASLLVWAGDNECDDMQCRAVYADGVFQQRVDPNDNPITRKLIPSVLRNEDFTRPYLPSSPYVDEYAFKSGKPTSEAHLWGSREFFKGSEYTDAPAHFASETGYHGCPSPESLAAFLKGYDISDLGDGRECKSGEWIVHCSSPETEKLSGFSYHYRNPLMVRQVIRLFKEMPKDIRTFAMQSQISQAEAKKFFIEHSRIKKWRKTGMIWWNLIDGWPQISDAVVDWYGRRKLAYRFIKRSQQPFCLMCDEPNNGILPLVAVNDTRSEVFAEYTVTEFVSGKKVAAGECTVMPDTSTVIDEIKEEKGGLYLIEWRQGGDTFKNTYAAGICDGLDFQNHLRFLEFTGDVFEGF